MIGVTGIPKATNPFTWRSSWGAGSSRTPSDDLQDEPVSSKKMNTQQPKLNIEKNNEGLKIFMFTVQGGPMQIEIAEEFKAVLAYNDQGALDIIRKDYPAGVTFHLKKRAEGPVKRIIDAVDLGAVEPKIEFIMPEPVPAEQSKASFVYSLMRVADKYVENARDRATLKRILGKISIK